MPPPAPLLTAHPLAADGFLNLALMRKAKKDFDRLEQSEPAEALKRFEQAAAPFRPCR